MDIDAKPYVWKAGRVIVVMPDVLQGNTTMCICNLILLEFSD